MKRACAPLCFPLHPNGFCCILSFNTSGGQAPRVWPTGKVLMFFNNALPPPADCVPCFYDLNSHINLNKLTAYLRSIQILAEGFFTKILNQEERNKSGALHGFITMWRVSHQVLQGKAKARIGRDDEFTPFFYARGKAVRQVAITGNGTHP